MTEFDTVVEKLTDYSSDLFLGRLIWFSIAETTSVDQQEFLKLVLTNFFGLDRQPEVPGIAKPFDVFKRACTHAVRKNVHTDDPDVRHNYMIRPTGSDPTKIWRTVVREAVDQSGHKLNYQELVTITFDRTTEKLRFANVDTSPDYVEDPVVTEIVEDVLAYIKDRRELITPYTMREFTRKYVERSLYGTRVRLAGGLYFVTENAGAEVEALDKTINALGDGASFHYLPVLDDSKQREMLRVAFESESAGEIDRLIGEMSEVMSQDKKISSTYFGQFVDESKLLRNRIAEYSDVLDEKMEATANRLEIMDTVIIELMSYVKAG